MSLRVVITTLLLISSITFALGHASRIGQIKSVLVGAVVCQTCFHQPSSSKANHALGGALVSIECCGDETTPTFRKEVESNNIQGAFSIPLPAKVEEHTHRIKSCSVKIIRNERPFLAVSSSSPSSTLQFKGKKGRTHIYPTGLLDFINLKQVGLRNRKRGLTTTANVIGSMKFPFSPNPFQPPSLFPPNPFAPPPSILPPNPFAPSPSIFPPNPFQPPPPSIFPPNPFFHSPPPPPPFFSFPPIPGLTPPPSPPPPFFHLPPLPFPNFNSPPPPPPPPPPSFHFPPFPSFNPPSPSAPSPPPLHLPPFPFPSFNPPLPPPPPPPPPPRFHLPPFPFIPSPFFPGNPPPPPPPPPLIPSHD